MLLIYSPAFSVPVLDWSVLNVLAAVVPGDNGRERLLLLNAAKTQEQHTW